MFIITNKLLIFIKKEEEMGSQFQQINVDFGWTESQRHMEIFY